MGTLAEALLAALHSFQSEVSTWTNQGLLTSIGGHIAQVENAVATDVHAGEAAAKTVLSELYGAFHGQAPAVVTEPAPGIATAGSGAVTPVVPALVLNEPAAEPVPAAPVAADPTPAPSTTPEASSAPSNEPSTSTEAPAAAEPTA